MLSNIKRSNAVLHFNKFAFLFSFIKEGRAKLYFRLQKTLIVWLEAYFLFPIFLKIKEAYQQAAKCQPLHFFHLLEGKSKQKADMTIWSQYWNCKKIESEAPCLSPVHGET